MSIRSAHDVGWLADLTVGRLMRQDMKTVIATTTITGVRQKYPLGSAKRLFVTSQSGQYCGVLDVAALYDSKVSNEPCLTAGDLATAKGLVLYPFQNVKTALGIFEKERIEFLPVVESGSGQVVGYLTEHYALRRYSQELEQRRSAELGERDLFSVAEPPPRP